MSKHLHVTALIWMTVGADSAGCWVAQGLEFNVAAQGKTEHEAKLRFMLTMTDQVALDVHENKYPLLHLGQGPQDWFDTAIDARASGPPLPVYIPAPIRWREERIFVTVQFLKAG